MGLKGVTIAIPNWNHELMLARSIDSALRCIRNLRDVGCPGEVMVVDADSRDGSLALLRQFEAAYYEDGLRVLAVPKNISLAAARNLAIESATYQYVGFVDADDELVPENFPSLWKSLEATGAAAAYGNVMRRTIATDEVHCIFSHESFQEAMYTDNYITSFGLMDGEQIRDVGGYHSDWKTLEDYEMWLHLATNGRRIVFVPIVMGYYDVLPDSMITQSAASTEAASKIRRIYNQLKARHHFHVHTRNLRYHPDVGYL